MPDGRVGLSFGRVADEYERARPEYPPEAVDRAVSELGLASASTVLDLAAGTGKLTRVLRDRFAHVVAVEPDDAMRAKIGGDARAGSAEAIPVDDASVDAVFVGDAFHWFETTHAVREIRRVLRPHGGVVVLFNSWPPPEEGSAARDVLDEVWRRFHGDRTFEGTWTDELEAAFGPLGHAEFERTIRYDGALYADLCVTASCPSALPDDDRARVHAALVEHLAGEHDLGIPTEVWWGRA